MTYERNETGGLDEMLATACAREPGSLPLLSFTLDELYHRREDTTLTLKAYREMGGLDGALGRRAEEAFVQYSDAACCGDQALAAQGLANVFRQLVTVGADAVGERIKVLQAILYKQLTGKGKAVQDKDEHELVGMLVQAMAEKQRALLVLDDVPPLLSVIVDGHAGQKRASETS